MRRGQRVSTVALGLVLGISIAVSRLVSAHESPALRAAELSSQIARGTGDATLYLERAQLFRLERRWRAAAADLDRAQAIEPGRIGVALGRADLELALGQPALAIAAARAALEREPANPNARLLLARALVAAGRNAEALPAFDAALDALPMPTPDHYLERARIALALHDPDQALAGLDRGVARLGSPVSLAEVAIEIETACGRWDAALGRLDRMAPAFANPTALMEQRGDILARARRGIEARAAWTEALAALERAPIRSGREAIAARLRQRLVAPVSNGGAELERRLGTAYLAPRAAPPALAPGASAPAALGIQVAVSPTPAGDGIESRADALDAPPSGAPAPVVAIDTTVTRGPYLQVGTQSRITIRWRTNFPTTSRVRCGTTPGTLLNRIIDGTATTEHEFTITGLAANTRYYYSLGTIVTPLVGDPSYTFVTAPSTTKTIRIWAIGDAGTGTVDQIRARDAYYRYTGSMRTDLWLMLGDNAYSAGTDAEYQSNVFNVYGDMFKQSVLWPTRGNHDGLYAGVNDDYYDIFTMPTAAEAGGLPSGSEAYYSYDYGNVHLICLDSMDSDRSVGGAMARWLRSDVAATLKDWIVAYWHHPPYTKGSHDSDNLGDSGGRMTDMRQNILPILDSTGVDVVLSGHSHSYERSYLLNGHYGLSTTLTDAMKKAAGDGRMNGTGPYHKATVGSGPFEGCVYIVGGSSGKAEGGALNHPAMVSSINLVGSLVIDVSYHRLDVRFIDTTSVVRDSLTIVKGNVASVPELGPPALLALDVPEPTPFVVSATVAYTLPRAGRVRLTVCDVTGRRVASLLDCAETAGGHRATWNGRDAHGHAARAGVYFAVLESGGETRARRLVRVE